MTGPKCAEHIMVSITDLILGFQLGFKSVPPREIWLMHRRAVLGIIRTLEAGTSSCATKVLCGGSLLGAES